MALLLFRQSGPADSADADQDGIPDEWEINGVNLTYPDGSSHFLDLKALKASPGHKDIIVWVDWMGDETLTENGKPQVHNHMPHDASLAIVKNAFANARQFTDNPDGTTGINLIILVSPTPVPHSDLLGSGDLRDGSVWPAFNAIRDGHFPAKLKGIAHYCLFAHDIAKDGTSGLSYDIGATDFIVSLGQWQDHTGNETEQAGTFMHELGHNLGLRHGGSDDLNYKPNYLGIMNYFFQTDGLPTPTGQDSINYSTFAFPDLDEGHLDETQPITTDSRWSNWGSAYFCPDDKTHSRTIPSISATLVDWNCDGKYTANVVADPNGDDPQSGQGLDVLRSQLDWNRIVFTYPAVSSGKSAGANPPAELTVSGANATPLPPASGLTALAQGLSVRLSWNPVPSGRVRGYEVVRSAPNDVPIVFVTRDLSYVDRLAKPVPQVRYEVRTLFVPHGASALVKATGKKLDNGLDVLTVGTMNANVSASLADKVAANQLQRSLVTDLRSVARVIQSAGGKRASAMSEITGQIRDSRLLLASQPASVEVKLQ